MIIVRRAAERGRTRLGWLDSRHTFSFGEYHDPDQMGFGHLRVINEDRVEPGRGFGTHGHRDMEILSFVLSGSLEHKDSTGSGSVIRPGDVQRMSAGTGVSHSESNPSPRAPVHFLQVWILPERTGLAPGYEQKSFGEAERRNRLCLTVSPDGRDGSLTIHQDARVYVATLEPSRTLLHAPRAGRKAWIQVTRGGLEVNGTPMREGDGAAVRGETRIEIGAPEEAEFLVFDLA